MGYETMRVTLLDHTIEPEYKVGHAAAICYDSDTSPDACLRRVKRVTEKGHLATLRFAYATFNVSGISRVCSHQLVRHVHLSYLQRSQRYCSELEIGFVYPRHPEKDGVLQGEIAKHYLDSRELYARMLQAGYKKGEARYVLPQASTTELNISGNLQSWRDFLKLRTDKSAQWEIREVAEEIKKQLGIIAPQIFG